MSVFNKLSFVYIKVLIFTLFLKGIEFSVDSFLHLEDEFLPMLFLRRCQPLFVLFPCMNGLVFL